MNGQDDPERAFVLVCDFLLMYRLFFPSWETSKTQLLAWQTDFGT